MAAHVSCHDLEENHPVDKPVASLPGRAEPHCPQSPLCKGHCQHCTDAGCPRAPRPVLLTSCSGVRPPGNLWVPQLGPPGSDPGHACFFTDEVEIIIAFLHEVAVRVTGDSACPAAGDPCPARPRATRIPKWDRTLPGASLTGHPSRGDDGRRAGRWQCHQNAVPKTFLEQ